MSGSSLWEKGSSLCLSLALGNDNHVLFRANGYYSPLTYFSSKVAPLLPLRPFPWSWRHDESLLRSSLISFLCVSYHLWCSGVLFTDSSGSYPPLPASGSSCSRWSYSIWPPLAWFSGCRLRSPASAWRVWLELLLCCSSASLEYSCSPRTCWPCYRSFFCFPSAFFSLAFWSIARVYSRLWGGSIQFRSSMPRLRRWLWTSWGTCSWRKSRFVLFHPSEYSARLTDVPSVWRRARRPGCYYSLCVRTQGSGWLSHFESFLVQRSLTLFFLVVVLVAEHLLAGHFLRVIHNSELYHSTSLREGEAVGSGPRWGWWMCIYSWMEDKRIGDLVN